MTDKVEEIDGSLKKSLKCLNTNAGDLNVKIKMVDVARYLGVSKATVSLAVNGKPGVNEEARKKRLSLWIDISE